MKQQLAVSS